MKKKLAIGISVLFSFLFVSYAFAAGFDGIVTCGRGGDTPCTFDDALKFINRTIDMIGIFSLIIATITFTLAGVRILLKPDNSSEREKAKEMFKKTMIGIFFLLAGFVIVKMIVGGLGVERSVDIFRWIKF